MTRRYADNLLKRCSSETVDMMLCSTSGALCARLFTKGAAEILLDQCALRVAEDSSVTYLGDEEKQQILQSFANEGSLRWA